MQGKIKNILTVCPRCHGTGKSRDFNKEPKYSYELQKRAGKLYAKGFSLREVAKKLGLSHPQIVKNILSR